MLNLNIIIVVKLCLLLLLLASLQSKVAGDSTMVTAIVKVKAELYYPLSVERFYKKNGYKLAWIAPDTVKMHSWDAMLLLDCVRQYGLSHADYHPKQLLYPALHQLIDHYKFDVQTAEYDVLLTDAMFRFMNDLHYGKLNPVYNNIKIDRGVSFKADIALSDALRDDFLSAIDNVQPRSKLYFDLQDHMRLLVGQRSGDCYVVPQGLIRKMAINMERLRWISTTGKPVHVTLLVKEGEVIEYKDIYMQDKSLERALYNERPFPQKFFKRDKFMQPKL